MSANSGITIKLSALTIIMFVFAVWGMPPLYQLFCEVTGIGLREAERAELQDIDQNVDGRTVRVQFIALLAGDLPWEFYSESYEMEVAVGTPIQTKFIAKNNSNSTLSGQAIPNIAPNNAVDYFHKTECFCFNNQQLQAGEQADLGVVFIVDSNLPKSVTTITLSYTMFDLTSLVSQN